MKLYELKKGTTCIIGELEYTFNGIDGMYGKWSNLESAKLVYGTAGTTLEKLGIIIKNNLGKQYTN